MAANGLDAFIQTVVDPPAECSWAWAAERSSTEALSVDVLPKLSTLPARLPQVSELFLWFGAPRHGALEPLLHVLSETERTTAQRFRDDADRWSFAAARAAVRTLLATALGCAPGEIGFARGPHGKPALDAARHGPDAPRVLHFNVSHSRGLVAVAVAGCRVGVDVERRHHPFPDLDAIAQIAFAPESRAALRGEIDEAVRAAMFYRLWTLGEAFIKATGEGVSQGLDTFAFTTRGVPALTRASGRWGPPSRWRFGAFPRDESRPL